MKIDWIRVFISTVFIICLFIGAGAVIASEPLKVEKWMTTGYLVNNDYVRCKKVWYPKDHICEDTKSFLKYFKPCDGGWCRR